LSQKVSLILDTVGQILLEAHDNGHICWPSLRHSSH